MAVVVLGSETPKEDGWKNLHFLKLCYNGPGLCPNLSLTRTQIKYLVR